MIVAYYLPPKTPPSHKNWCTNYIERYCL